MDKALRVALAAGVTALAFAASSSGALAAAPANDNFASATSISGESYSAVVDTTEATTEVNEQPNTVGSSDDKSVWYSWTAPSNGRLAVFTCSGVGGRLNSTLGIWTGAAVGALTRVGGVNGSNCPFGWAGSVLGASVRGGTVYHFKVGNPVLGSGGVTTMNLNFSAAPANDDFAAAEVLSGDNWDISEATTSATLESSEPDTGYTDSDRVSVWYRWTAPYTGDVQLDTAGSAFVEDSVLAVYTGSESASSPSALSPVASSGDSMPVIEASVTAGSTYWIYVASKNASNGYNFSLRLRGRPEATSAPAISGTPVVDSELSSDTGSWVGYGEASFAAQWLRCDSDGGSCSKIEGADQSTYTVTLADVGHTLRVSVTASNDSGTSATAQSDASDVVPSPPPANDDFASATDLGSVYNGATEQGSTAGATLESGEVSGASSVWFKWTAPEAGNYRLSLCDATGMLSSVMIYGLPTGQEAAIDNLTQLWGLTGIGCAGSMARPTISGAEAGRTYWLRIADSVSTGMSYHLTLTSFPHFTSPPAISGGPLTGEQLSSTDGSYEGETATGGARTWTRCDASGDNCSDIADSNSNTYTPQAADVGHRLRLRYSLTNALGSGTSTSGPSALIVSDRDSDAVADSSDTCPDDAGAKLNGCPTSVVQVTTQPSYSGTPKVGEPLTVSPGAAVKVPASDSSVAAPSVASYAWQRCDDPDHCSAMGSVTGSSYTPVEGDVDKLFMVTVRWSNTEGSDTATAMSAATAAVSSGGGPAAPVDPVVLPVVGATLGTLKAGSGKLSLKKLALGCGSSATGSCSGSAALSGKAGSVKLSLRANLVVAPGGSAVVSFKLSKKQLKAIKKAKKVKARVKLSFGAPGFPAHSLTAGFTLKP